METRTVICPRCHDRVKVRDIQHFKRHGVKLSRWGCPVCSHRVASDRCYDLRDHLRRRHPDDIHLQPVPVWAEIEEEAEVHGQRRRRNSRRASREEAPSKRRKESPAAAASVPPAREQTPDDCITLHIGDTDPDFTSAEEGVGSPSKVLKSLVRTIKPLSPLPPSEGEEEESERARVLAYVRGLSAEQWIELQKDMLENRPRDERQSRAIQVSTQRRDRSTETLTFAQEPHFPCMVAACVQTSATYRPARVSQASQTTRGGALLIHRADQGVHLELADGASITIPGPVQEVNPR